MTRIQDLNTTKHLPTHRKQLNIDQLRVLSLLHRFRFASSRQIASYSFKKTEKSIQKRLKILENRGLIAKRYDKSYKLRGKPAAYYLLPKGARALEKLQPPANPIKIKTIYTDGLVSENFISHSRHIMDACLELRQLYLQSRLEFFTKSELNYDDFDHFPQPLADVYIRLHSNRGELQYFLDIFEDTEPYFVLIRRAVKYINYAAEGDWAATETTLPIILFVVGNKSIEKRLRKRLTSLLEDNYEEELKFATASLPEVLDLGARKDNIWRLVDGFGDDPDDPPKPKSLLKLAEPDE
jgi:hypothetical protein